MKRLFALTRCRSHYNIMRLLSNFKRRKFRTVMLLFTLVSIIMVYHNQRYIYQQRAYTSSVVSQLIDYLNVEKEEPPLKNTSMIGNLKDTDNLDIPLVHIAYVACGDEAYQVINSIRSALYFSNDVAIKFHIFTQSKFENKFHVRFREWHIVFDTQFSYP